MNDTTHLIFKLYERDKKNAPDFIAGSIVFPAIDIWMFLQFGPPVLINGEGAITLYLGGLCAIGTVICISNAIPATEHSSREYLYHSLNNYFNNHTFDHRNERYISNHINDAKY